jgi:hypothetical protein
MRTYCIYCGEPLTTNGCCYECKAGREAENQLVDLKQYSTSDKTINYVNKHKAEIKCLYM